MGCAGSVEEPIATDGKQVGASGSNGMELCPAPSLGVLRLDLDYPAAKGDIAAPDTFPFDVVYRVVPGLTFEMCRSGKLPPAIQQRFVEAVTWLDRKGVSGISGDCGFMMYFQDLARQHTNKPVFLSSLIQMSAITAAYARQERVAIFTANSKDLWRMCELIKQQCNVDFAKDKRFTIIGCEDVDGFEAVANGTKVDYERVERGVVAKAKTVVAENPGVFRAFCFECTQMPPFSDAVRHATGVPVFDIVTCCNFFVSAMRDNERFGLANWQHTWDGKQQKHVYQFGGNLSPAERSELVSRKNGAGSKPTKPKAQSNNTEVQNIQQKKKAPVKKEPQFIVG